MLRNLILDEDGVTAVEYAVMIAVFSLAIIGAVTSLAQALSAHFNDVETAVDGI